LRILAEVFPALRVGETIVFHNTQFNSNVTGFIIVIA
jgi:hypothetical protein